ncbi:nucleotidyltransferase family protein [Erythrobacter sp. JK5]|uniref:nucleotidyltransferase family protein n=1 Tax=Erythrobacter sp. JK5 TaxID=2829500 RepID=UPI001BA8ED84|nr:nucleotidyltransferase family protein [Erythrobacter sp. JK5]QUL37659.1 nucleotidyltransferase family protein [Erythrobacter sp. JK5]
MQNDAFDLYLGQCVRCALQSAPLPAWPGALALDADEAASRISFHGLALLLVETMHDFRDWPAELVTATKEEARLQRFWEMDHARAISGLLEALQAAGLPALVLKGTALAYSLYPDPAIRRRGDSDILIEKSRRPDVREVFTACGFQPGEELRPFQECWRRNTQFGFDHVVDLHWRISASPVIAAALDASRPADRAIDLPRLSAHARATGYIDNLILTCINRASHRAFGYMVGNDKLYESDRLIWAVDIDRLAAAFAADDWETLVRCAAIGGCSDIVLSGLAFAEAALGTPIPDRVKPALGEAGGEGHVARYLGTDSTRRRLTLDLAATSSLRDKVRVMRSTLLPGPEILRERFPEARDWPIAALQARRLLGGLGDLVRGRI